MTQTIEATELNYLEEMGEKAEEILKKNMLNKPFPVSPEDGMPIELMEMGGRILIQVAAANTAIRGYHVESLMEGHLFLLNVQDKFKNTVADAIFTVDVQEEFWMVEDVTVGFKAGAILHRYEELHQETVEQAEVA